MPITQQARNDASDAAIRPVTSTDSGARLTLSNASAATPSLTAGEYEVILDKTGGVCWLAFAATVTVPTSGAAPNAGTFAVHDGSIIQVPAGGSQVAAAMTGTNTGELALVTITP